MSQTRLTEGIREMAGTAGTAGTAEVVLAEIRESRLSVDEVLDAVRHPESGAIATFVGVVRERDRGRGVEALEYTCHPSAPQVLREVAQQVATAAGVIRVAVTHRVGRLALGDIAVVVAVSAAHRGDALDACRELIDEVKVTVPIWKHQIFEDGTDEWVGTP